MPNAYEKLGACTFDNLIAGNTIPIMTQSATIKAGEGQTGARYCTGRRFGWQAQAAGNRECRRK